ATGRSPNGWAVPDGSSIEWRSNTASGGPGAVAARPGSRSGMHRARTGVETMESNPALKLLRILRQAAKGKPVTDAELRKLTGFDQVELDLAAEQLEAEGMLSIERIYTLFET